MCFEDYAVKYKEFSDCSDTKHEKKILVWHSHNFLLPYITVEEYFIISITSIFNLYFICFAVDELPAFIIIVYNF